MLHGREGFAFDGVCFRRNFLFPLSRCIGGSVFWFRVSCGMLRLSYEVVGNRMMRVDEDVALDARAERERL